MRFLVTCQNTGAHCSANTAHGDRTGTLRLDSFSVAHNRRRSAGVSGPELGRCHDLVGHDIQYGMVVPGGLSRPWREAATQRHGIAFDQIAQHLAGLGVECNHIDRDGSAIGCPERTRATMKGRRLRSLRCSGVPVSLPVISPSIMCETRKKSSVTKDAIVGAGFTCPDRDAHLRGAWTFHALAALAIRDGPAWRSCTCPCPCPCSSRQGAIARKIERAKTNVQSKSS